MSAEPASEAAHRFSVTLFDDVYATRLSVRSVTISQLADIIAAASAPTKDDLPLIKLAIYGDDRSAEGSLRHDGNVKWVHGIETDYDDEEMSFDEAVKRVRAAGLAAILYTTPSHTPQEPRWRALFPFTGQMLPAGRKNMLDRANAIFGGVLAPESWALSTAFYYGAVSGDFRIEIVEGDPIDVRPDLGAHAKVLKGSGHIAALPKRWQDIIHSGDASAWGGKRWRAVCAVARVLVDHGWTDADITAVLLNRGYRISAHPYAKGNPERTAARAIVLARRIPPEIEELNRDHAVILVGDKAAVLREFASPEGRPAFALMGLDAFRTWLAPRKIGAEKVVKGVVVEERVPLAPVWLSHCGRRQYEGLIFAPGRGVPRYYNLWRGFAVEPRKGDCSRFLDHLLKNVCRGDKGLCGWLIAWFASLFQRPADKDGTSVVLRGPQGTGKTKVGEVIGSLLGDHYVLVSDPRYITGRFNSHLVSCLLLHADEGFWAGDRAAEGRLKDLVTGDHQLIEFKGKEPVRVRNHVRLLVSGNPDWLVPAGMEERRFAVLQMGEGRMEDHKDFAAIDAQMDNGGREALLYHLLFEIDLSKINLRIIPKTEALLDQKIETLGAFEKWWLTTLREGPASGRLLRGQHLPGQGAAPALPRPCVDDPPQEPAVNRDAVRHGAAPHDAADQGRQARDPAVPGFLR
jgi:hypothetical protein